MKIIRSLLALIIVVFFISNSNNYTYANDQINFENITIDDGLSQSTVESILQDSDGYMWIGTNDGLNRYNGSEFKVYKNSKQEVNSIANNHILTLLEDNERNLWVGTVDGLSVINLDTYSVKNYLYYGDERNKPFNNIHDFFLRENGQVLMATYDGLFLYNEEKDSFEELLVGDEKLGDLHIENIEEDEFNNLWIGTTKSLYKINMKSKEIIDFSTYTDYKIEKIDSLMYDNDGNIWVGTSGNGLFRIDVKKNIISSYSHTESDENSIPSNTVKTILQDKSGTVWVGTDKGLGKLTKENVFRTYKNKSYDINSLSSNYVYHLIEDKDGLIWAGTYTGVSIFDSSNNIQLYKNDPLDDNTISDNVIHGIYEDKEGIIWIGTKDKGLNLLDRDKNKISHIIEGSSKYHLSSNSIKVITGKDNIIWVGTRNGVNRINKEDMNIKKYTVNEGLSSNNIKSLYINDDGYLWIGSDDGLDILDTNSDRIINMTERVKLEGIKEIHIEEIYEDEDGIYWIGDLISGGLMKINPHDGSFKVFTLHNSEYDEEEGINGIKSIAEGNDRIHLWIGTTNGLYEFNKVTEEFKKYTEEDGLSNNYVYGVLFDDDGNPWMSTNNGISKFDLKKKKFTTITSTDGLQSNEFNGKAYCKLRSGEFVFGGVKGLNIFNSEKIISSFETPKVVFDNFEVDGKNYNSIDGKKFKHNENLIRIKFFIPQYKNNSNIQYYYKLEGQSNDWIKIRNNEVIFNELGTGNYTFRIKARSQDGSIGKENSVNFTIEAPPWFSKTAIFIYVFILINITFLSITKVKRLDKLVAKRTEELSEEMEKNNNLFNQLIQNERSKNNYFINLSHELRTPLNVISSVEQLITSINHSEKGVSREKLDYYMDVMRNNTKRLLNLINNIIDTSKIENGRYKICKKEYNIVYIVEETALSMKDAIESDNINLIIDTDVEEKKILCDRHEIERCIVNLISNAFKFTPEGGSIIVDIKDKDDKIMITIEDTGIGIEEEYHDAIFDRFNQVVDEHSEVKGGSGLGLTITKHIIDMHNGEIYVESEKDKGSKFVIILPVK